MIFVIICKRRESCRHRKGQKVRVHILQELFYFKHLQGRDVDAKNGDESYPRLSPERTVRTENSYSNIQYFSVSARYI